MIKRLAYNILVIFISIILILTPFTPQAQNSNIDKIRFLQIFTILKYLIDENPSSSTICFVGNDNIFNIIKKASAANSRLKNAEFKSLAASSPELSSCNIVYISDRLNEKRIKSVMSLISSGKKYIVSISDTPNFIRKYNGTVYLFFEDGPKFFLNLKGATDRNYKMSSKFIESADEAF